MKFLCENCGKEVERVQYWKNSKFHENQRYDYVYCGPSCSTEHYEKMAMRNLKHEKIL